MQLVAWVASDELDGVDPEETLAKWNRGCANEEQLFGAECPAAKPEWAYPNVKAMEAAYRRYRKIILDSKLGGNQ